jgi:protein O-GlcNAc transferase
MGSTWFDMPYAHALGHLNQSGLPVVGGRMHVEQSVSLPKVCSKDGALEDSYSLYRCGKYVKAVEICEDLERRGYSSAESYLIQGACEYQLRRFDRCIQCNNAAIKLKPHMAEAYANMGNAYLQKGFLDSGIFYYSTAINLKPDFVEAMMNLAVAYTRKGWYWQAITTYSSVSVIKPMLVDVHCSMGALWRLQGDPVTAITCYNKSLQIDSRCWAAWHGLAECAREMGSLNQALAYYTEAENIKADAAVYNGKGLCYNGLKLTDKAEVAFSKAARLLPSCPYTLGNLAGALYENKKLEQSISTYRQALCINPTFPEALNNLGNALREAGKYTEAVACYTSCIQLQMPSLGAQSSWLSQQKEIVQRHVFKISVAYNNLGGILKIMGRLPECVIAYQHVVMLQPNTPEAHVNLASAYKDMGRHDEAIQSYKGALLLRPHYPDAFANMVHSFQSVCDWSGRREYFAKLESYIFENIQADQLPCVQPFHALSYPFSAELALQISKKYAQHCLQNARQLPGTVNKPLGHPISKPLEAGKKLKIAYVSSDFGDHPLSHLMGSVFGLHASRNKSVEAHCYSLSPDDGSIFYKRVKNESHKFRDVSSWTAYQIANQISLDGIHIAVNLNGYTKGARNEVFAYRPAPIQISLMGFPATMGADYIDYIILDKVVCPPASRKCYSESVAYMPHTYFVNDYKHAHQHVLEDKTVPSRSQIGLPEDKIIYSCANQLYKYDPDTFKTWCSILKRVPNSVLWLLRFPPAGELRIRAAAMQHGVESSRIIFTDVARKPDHIARTGLADIFLDTPLCNAHTTGCDVLWGGCPIITLPLERMASRVAASLCNATGLGDEMIATSLQDYEDRAVQLGVDKPLRERLRRRLREARMSCPLFDTDRYVDNLDRAYVKMWDIHAQQDPPQDFEITE